MKDQSYTIKDVTDGIKNGEFTAQEIFDSYKKKAEAKNSELNAYLSIFESPQLEIGNWKLEIDRASLGGVPCAIKDNILIEGERATAGSKILENYTASYDATVIRKLKSAGATFLGKTNMDEFAMGSSTENSAFGPVKNPVDTSRVPGGSSGGSTVAVASDMAVFALGSDTGGSIRQPASLCGIVGLKPTYGRVSRHGLIAMASSLDQIGPLTKNVYDSALVLNTLAGEDTYDSTTVSKPEHDFTHGLDKSIKGLRVGIPKEFFGQGLDSEVEEQVRKAIGQLKDLGCEIVELSLPNIKYALAVYYIVMPCEVSANLSRFDGVRYGYASKKADNLIDAYFLAREQGFGPEPKRRIVLGTYALSSGYYDAYYLKAQKVRALIRQDFDKAFEKVDVIVGPTTPTTAFKIGEKSSDPLAMYLSDIYTVPANLAGIPAISIPCGNSSVSNLPVGFQIMGKMFDEATVLNVAYQLEQQIK